MKKDLKEKLALADKIAIAGSMHTERGWCRASFFDGNKKACATGWLLEVFVGDNFNRDDFEDNIDSYAEIGPAVTEIAKDLLSNDRVSTGESWNFEGIKNQSIATEVIIDFNDMRAYNNWDVRAQFDITANRLRAEVYQEQGARDKVAGKIWPGNE